MDPREAKAFEMEATSPRVFAFVEERYALPSLRSGRERSRLSRASQLFGVALASSLASLSLARGPGLSLRRGSSLPRHPQDDLAARPCVSPAPSGLEPGGSSLPRYPGQGRSSLPARIRQGRFPDPDCRIPTTSRPLPAR